MKKLAYLLIFVGLLTVLYSVAGKYMEASSISLYGLTTPMNAATGMLIGNTILLLALLLSLQDKMRGLANLLGVAGVGLFICSIAGRVLGVETISFFGYLQAMSARTLAIGANTLLIIAAVLTLSVEKK